MTQLVLKPKISILDDPVLRDEVFYFCNTASFNVLFYFAKRLTERAFCALSCNAFDIPEIENGFFLAEQRINAEIRAHELRLAGFSIHALAKTATSEPLKTALRVAGHSVSVAHMRTHAIVATDYAIKLSNLLHPNDVAFAHAERVFQIGDFADLSKKF